MSEEKKKPTISTETAALIHCGFLGVVIGIAFVISTILTKGFNGLIDDLILSLQIFSVFAFFIIGIGLLLLFIAVIPVIIITTIFDVK